MTREVQSMPLKPWGWFFKFMHCFHQSMPMTLFGTELHCLSQVWDITFPLIYSFSFSIDYWKKSRKSWVLMQPITRLLIATVLQLISLKHYLTTLIKSVVSSAVLDTIMNSLWCLTYARLLQSLSLRRLSVVHQGMPMNTLMVLIPPSCQTSIFKTCSGG